MVVVGANSFITHSLTDTIRSSEGDAEV